jgi:ribosome-associated protein
MNQPAPSPAAAAGSAELQDLITRTLQDGSAEDIVNIDLAGKSSIADAMIIASGRSSRHVGALAERLMLTLKRSGAPRLSVEGERQADWVLVDAGDVIVHLFRGETRLFYNLEKMWSTLPAEAGAGA